MPPAQRSCGWAAKERQIEVREQPQKFVAHSGRHAVRRGAPSRNDLADQLDRGEAALRELAPDAPAARQCPRPQGPRG